MNSNELALFAPSMPAWALYPVLGLSLVFVVLAMIRMRNRAAAFMIGASWLRLAMQSMHAITYRPLVAGMSANAVGSIALFLVGLLTINWRHLALRFMLPFYVLIAIACVSALANNGPWNGLITVVTKYGFLIVVTLSVYNALQSAKGGSFMTALLWSFAPVLLLQLLSLALGVAKATETDANAASYIGGFNHEAVFSVILATCLTIVVFNDRLNRLTKFGLVIACVGGIVLANYRTTLVAIAPLLLVYFGFSSLHRFPARDRPFIVSLAAVLVVLALAVTAFLFASRFQDVTVLFSGDVNLIKPPHEYSVDETRLLSGRPRIWSMYIYGWTLGGPLQHVIGFGPESWSQIFPLYAHNTLVNYLFEFGIVGVVGVLFLWFSMLGAAFRVRHHHRPVLIGAHFMFLTLNMSTMPMWMIEGNMLYGIICGYTLYLLSLQGRTPQTQTPQKPRASARPPFVRGA
ncbi:MAG: hypothetical protein DCF16_05160 [Alphaproteobacteria bacterium]|nr:MAG: hypothetical protein DCF16_05160 [Alphaproteobacteria bacterium]